MDLSFPRRATVNDGIPSDLCSLWYLSIDLAVQQILNKLDIEDAYRIVPVHLDDWLLLGMRWRGHYYVTSICHLA